MGFFDDILTSRVGDEVDRKTIAELSAKYGLNGIVEGLDGTIQNWEKWRRDNIVEDPGNPNIVHTKAEIALRQRAQELEGRVGELEASNFLGGDVDFDQVVKEIEKRNYAKREDLEKVVAPIKGSTDEINKKVDQNYRNMTVLFAKSWQLPTRHYKEFGEEIEGDKFWSGYNAPTNTQYDPEKYYDIFVAEKRSAKMEAASKAREEDLAKKETEYQEKVKLAKEEGIKEGRLAAQMSRQSLGMPADQGEAEMGYMQKATERRLRGEKDVPAEDVDPAPGKTLGQGLWREGLAALQKSRQGMVQ